MKIDKNCNVSCLRSAETMKSSKRGSRAMRDEARKHVLSIQGPDIESGARVPHVSQSCRLRVFTMQSVMVELSSACMTDDIG